MKQLLSIGIVLFAGHFAAAQSPGVRGAALARASLALSIAKDPEVLKAVRAKNASGEDEEEIHRKDREWTQNPQFPLRKTLTTSPCAERLRDLTKADANVVEVILMDKNGANVCVSRETTDYWQGDEPKFQRTFGAAKPIFVDDPAFDESAGVYAIQISALVYDGKTKAGALTLGLRLSQRDLGAKR